MVLFIVGAIVGLGLLLFLLIKFIDGNQGYWTKENVHQVHGGSLYGMWDRFLFRILLHENDRLLYNALKKKKTGLKFGGTTLFRHPMLYVLDLDLVKNILVKDFDHFTNRRGIDFGDPEFDKMLFNMVNQEWKDLRATMSPTFTTSKIKRMFGVFNESGEKMVNFLNQEIRKNGPEIDLRSVCGKYTMDVIASAAFGVDSQNFENENSPFASNARKFQDTFGKTLMLKFMLLLLFPGLAKKFQMSIFNKEALGFLGGVIRESIRRRKENGERRNDFLQLMIEAQGETNSEIEHSEDAQDQYDKDAQLDLKKVNKTKLTDELVIAQCNLFFVAGFDTTESLLMWASYELALHPQIQQKLYDDLRSATSNGNKKELTYEGLNQIEYLDMVVSGEIRTLFVPIQLEKI